MNEQVEQKTFLDKPVFVWLISGLILYSVACFSLETVPSLSHDFKTFLRYSEIFVVAIFTVEYLLRIFLSSRKLGFVFSFYGVIDLLAILPFYLAFAIDLRSLRLFRLLRLLRVLKLARYHSAVLRFSRALYLSKEELIIFTAFSLILLFLAAVGIYHFEHAAQPDKFRSIFDCLWWSVATLTTVGYGDIYPITIGGRIFTFAILMIGLGMVAIPTGIISSALSATHRGSGANSQE